jgi:general secretion pathway protein G
MKEDKEMEKTNLSFKKFIATNARGFSLIEILIALTLLGIAGTFISGRIFDQLHEGQVQSTKIQMNALAARLQEYRRKCGIYPTTEQGLQALVSKPSGGRDCRNYPANGFLETPEVPRDPWDEEFVFISDGRTFNIISYGPDGMEGGEGKDKDIYLYESQNQSGEDY